MWGTVAFVLFIMASFTTIHCEPRVPCYFIFGDSLSDVGNNNNLNTKAKANYPPYGIDFPGGIPTGRFSNGLNFVDRISQLVGFDEFIPAFSIAKGPEIMKGVNYASGAAGIRSETGAHLGDRISMDKQLRNHLVTIARFAVMGQSSVLTKCLYTVYIGSNDYINNYFMPQYYVSSSLYNPEQYAEVLILQYAAQLTTLYSYGARKVALPGLGLIGCALAEISMHGTNGSLCVDNFNDAAELFNKKLISLVDDLNRKLPNAQFTYINTANSETGSAIANATCCKVRDDYQCLDISTTCADRENYIFWDGFHTTQVVNKAVAESAFNAAAVNNYVYPVDINTLLSTDPALMTKATDEGHMSVSSS